MALDVIVVGLGTMGAATAYQLAVRGARVVGLDRYRPPHRHGAHGGGSRIIRLAYAEHPAYVPLARRAYEMWREIEVTSDVPLLTTTGGLNLGRPDSAVVSGALRAVRQHGLPHEVLAAAELRRRFPAFAPADDEVGVYEEVAGALRPEQSVATLLDLAERAGADLRFGAAVSGWRASSSGVTVRTAGGELTAGHLVLCPGPWAPEVLTGMGVPFDVQRRVQMFWRGAGAEFSVGRCPVWIWESEPGCTAYGTPSLPGPPDGPADAPDLIKAAFHSGHERSAPSDHPEPPRPEETRAVMRWLERRMPSLHRADWAYGQPCLYTLTPDQHFVIGAHPAHETVSVAAGFSGHGFKFAPVVGEILAELVTDGATRHAIDLFAPTRFAAGRVA